MGDLEQQPSYATRRRRPSIGTMLYVGAPAEAPSEPLLNCVREMVKHSVSISAAYAFVMAVGESTPSFSIGIYFDHKPSSHEVNALFSRIGYYMRPFLGESGYVDLLPLDPTDVLAVTVRDQIKPFYQRRLQ
jgi:type III secretion system (T3SS) SseB-like protein